MRGATRLLARALAALAACALAWAVGLAQAQDVLPVPPLSDRVIDQTATLSAAQHEALDAKLAAIEKSTGSQIVVLLVPTTRPEDIASYAQRVADQWKIGRRDVGDGLLIVVEKNEHRVRIEVAKALEGAIPDLEASRIISGQITPAFRAGDFAGGLNAAIDRLAERIRGEGLAPPSASSQRPAASQRFPWQSLPVFFFIGVPVLGAVLTAIFGRKPGSFLTGLFAGGLGWWVTSSLLLGGAAGVLALLLVGVMGTGASRRGGGIGGGPIIWGGGGGGGFGGGGGGGGGGFGSGGGGDFGGGGASGDW